MTKLSPCLWFDDNAEEAVSFYMSIFENSEIIDISRYPASDEPAHHEREGSVMFISFMIEGQTYTALNGGPRFQFNEALSLQVICDSQQEIDYYWAQLGSGGSEEDQRSSWLKDRFGVSWQVIPRHLVGWLTHRDSALRARVVNALLEMVKPDIAALKLAAYAY
jgi:predicted 3-demethylubiquinone-9 3-methyltransferase (glyoxalase superfamily)